MHVQRAHLALFWKHKQNSKTAMKDEVQTGVHAQLLCIFSLSNKETVQVKIQGLHKTNQLKAAGCW